MFRSLLILPAVFVAANAYSNSCTPSEYVAPEAFKSRALGERGAGHNVPETVQFDNTNITIKPVVKDGKVLVGMVGTQNHLIFDRANISFEARSCLADGLRAAVWLQSVDNAGYKKLSGVADIKGLEIDIIEMIRGRGKFTFFAQSLHWGGYGDGHKIDTRRVKQVKPCEWAEYGLTFDDDNANFSINGVQSASIPLPKQPSSQYLIVSVEAPSRLKTSRTFKVEDGTDLGVFEVRNLRYCKH